MSYELRVMNTTVIPVKTGIPERLEKTLPT